MQSEDGERGLCVGEEGLSFGEEGLRFGEGGLSRAEGCSAGVLSRIAAIPRDQLTDVLGPAWPWSVPSYEILRCIVPLRATIWTGRNAKIVITQPGSKWNLRQICGTPEQISDSSTNPSIWPSPLAASRSIPRSNSLVYTTEWMLHTSGIPAFSLAASAGEMPSAGNTL